RLKSGNHIDDPQWYHDDLLWRLSIERPLYRIQGQNGSLDLTIFRIAWHSNITSLTPVDLHRQRHGVFDQQRLLDLRPGLLRDERRTPLIRRPAGRRMA